MEKPRILVTRRWPDAVERQLALHFDATFNNDDTPLSPAALKAALTEYDALFPTVTDRIDAEVLSAQPLRTRLIGNYGVGFNNIDTAAAKARGLVVTNTPDVLTDATADLTMALILAVARRVVEGDRHVRDGAWTGWRPTHMLGTQVTGKTLGLIGFGRIGRAVAKRAHLGFDMPVLFHDPYPPDPTTMNALGATYCGSIAEVLEQADIVSLHCPATPESRHLINAARLGRMKPGAILVNTSRGDVVNEADLIAALEAGQIAGAGLDVFEREPAVPSGLIAKSDVVLLPHLGSATEETRIAMGLRVLDNALAFFADAQPRDRVA